MLVEILVSLKAAAAVRANLGLAVLVACFIFVIVLPAASLFDTSSTLPFGLLLGGWPIPGGWPISGGWPIP